MKSIDPGEIAQNSPLSLAARGTTGTRLVLGTFIAFIFVTLLLGPIGGSSASTATPTESAGGTIALAGSPAPAVASTSGSLQLGAQAAPGAICVDGLETCAAGVGYSEVTLSASPTPAGISWPAVQVAFILETTNYDGAGCYSACASDACNTGPTSQGDCEQANGPQFLMYHAQQVADSIQSANPHTTVTFALIDGFATDDYLDDGDDAQYHVDTPQFTSVADFGQVALQVKSNLFKCENGWTYCDSGMADSWLHSDSITELFGAVAGFGLDWSPNAHHVIVLMTSSAPRAPGFQVNYAPSYKLAFGPGTSMDAPGAVSSTCEPSYAYSSGLSSPECEGWVASQDGNATHSIAALAHTAPNCVDAIGGTCTIDVIDLWDTSTDPLSLGWWPNAQAGGPTPDQQQVISTDVDHILLSACELAAATGGSWDGPAWFACPDGQQGTIQFVPHGPLDDPNTNDPTLFNAITQISFGPIVNTQIARGTGQPIFTFVPIGNIALATGTNLDLKQTCLQNGQPFKSCAPGRLYQTSTGVVYLGWNWSVYANNNSLYFGDTWTASFNVYATGPPYGTVPVDACITIFCQAAGSGSIDGLYSWAHYIPYTNASAQTQSFPLVQIDVEPPPPTTPLGTGPPPVSLTPPSFPIAAPSPLPVIQQLGIANNVGIGNVSLNATAAGFLGAGFVRMTMKNKPIAMQMAMKSGPAQSKFDKGADQGGPSLGHFE